MKKLTFLFALLCASMMGFAAIDWDGIGWLPNSNEKYKLFISPNFGDQFGGKRVENGTNLWIGFPSAAFGDMSITPNGGDGAWRTFALSNFPNKENVFTVVCEGTTYTFTVYYADGTEGGGGGPTPTPGEKFVAANASIVDTYFATGGGWTADPGSNASYNDATGVISVHIDQVKSAQWQGQVKLALGFVYSAEKYYDFSIKFHASKAVNGVTLKSNNDNVLFFENQSVNLPANEDYVWTKSDVAGVAGDNNFVFDFGGAAAGTDITISEISIIEKDAPSAPAVVETYCRKATGHLGNAEFGDANGRILLTLRKTSDSSVRVKVEPNNNGNDYFDLVHVELNGVAKELGTVGGAALTDIEFDYTGLASLDFSVNVLWHNHNWADVNGRWSTGAVAVKEAELCEETTELSVGSEYCCYYGNETKTGSRYATLTWETNEDGDVVITIGDGPGETNTTFRGNNGLGGDLNGFTVLSGANFATSEPASDYFNRVYSGDGGKTYILQKKGGVTLPSPAKIHFQGPAFEWKCTEEGNAYTNPTFEYTYRKICSQLDAPTNVAINANNIITFNAVAGADSYKAYVYLAGVEKYSQAVASGDVLTYTPLVTGDYVVNVIASGAGKVDSDPSADYVWHLEAAPIVLGNSEYCEKNMSSGNTLAAFTWETDENGNIIITISEVLGGAADAAHFRGNGMALDKFKIGVGKTPASTYFNHACGGSNQVTLSLKNPANAPALGEKIYFTNSTVEYTTSKDGNAWPSLTFEYTYGTVCSGKSVSATVNNNTMGSAVAKVGDDEVTSVNENTEVTFIATSADPALYRFVNWTKGGVEVSTSATYAMTITETTNLVANFDYIREAYCHYELLSNESAVQGKKLYMTVGAIGGGDYRIMFEGSAEAPFTGLQDANFVINQVTAKTDVDGQPKTGQDVPFTKANGRWNFSADGYGKAWIEFSLAEGKTIDDIYVWANAIYFNTASGVLGYADNNDRLGLFGMNAAKRHNIDWDATCSDTEAPVFDKAEAEVLNESSVRLKIQATDNWGGLLTYTIARAGVDDIVLDGASGEELTQDVTGLTAGTQYDFTVTVSDGVNNANTHILVTPVGDTQKPVMTSASLDSKTWNSAIINVAATDNKGVTAYYVVEKDADYVATEGKITIEGLTANTNYTLHIKAKDAAGNISDNQAEVSFTTDAHSLVPTTAAPVPTWPAEQVKSIYSDTYELAPANVATYNAPWWNAPAITLGEIDGNHYMDYNLANNGMIGWQYDQISVATMEKLHIDIYASAAGTLTVRPIIDGDGALNDNRKTLTLVAQQWNSFDIELTEFGAHDWTKLFQFSIENWDAGGLTGEHISVDNVYFYRTTELVDNEKPTNVSANVAKASFGSITLNVSGEDNQGTVLYSIKIGDTEYAQGAAASGASKAFTLSGLTQGTDYSITVIASDESGNEANPVIVAAQTNAITAAPVPTHIAALVRSVYCDAYETALAHDFLKNTWTDIPYSELNIDGDHVLAYTNPNMPNQMPDVAWGVNNDEGNAIIAKDGFNDGTNKGLDVRNMQYIHFDIWSSVATTYPELRLNDTPAGSIVLDGSGWQSFDLDITSLTDAQKSNIRWIKFIAFRDPAPEDIVIDNVYFYNLPETITLSDTEDNATLIAEKNNALANVTLTRTFPLTTEWYTLCLPFDLDNAQLTEAFGAGYTLATLATSEDRGSLISLNFDFVHSFEAGKAYLLRPGTSVTENPVFEGVTIKNVNPEDVAATSTYMNFQGTFNTITLTSENQRFVGPQNYLYSPAEGGTNMKAFRCFFTIPTSSPLDGAPARPARIVFGSQVATDIDNVAGEQLQSTKVLRDGQLYIIRDGRTYNAQGMLVK